LNQDEPVLKVKDLMTMDLITTQTKDSVTEAAGVMTKNGISSVIVKDGNKFAGIITDHDIISKVVSKGLNPREITVGEVMSAPLITISPDATIGEAAKKMRDNKIRRLLVEKNHQKLGTIVESDIIGVDPELHFVIREKSKLEPQFRVRPREVTFSGYCQDCENYSDDLRKVSGRWLCEECRS
jgi:CBS domain-containing protein